MKIKEDTKWVLIAFFVGLISHFLFIVSSFEFNYSYIVSKIAPLIVDFIYFIYDCIYNFSKNDSIFYNSKPDYKINKAKTA